MYSDIDVFMFSQPHVGDENSEMHEKLDEAAKKWHTATLEDKQAILKATCFSTANTLPLLTSEDKRNGTMVTSITQHPLHACSREIRKECLEAFYHCNTFTVSFDLSTNQLGMSDLATALKLLPLSLMRALLTRKPPILPSFERMTKTDKSRLCISFYNFKDITLASLMHWTSLTFSNRLALKNFESFEGWQRSGFNAFEHNSIGC